MNVTFMPCIFDIGELGAFSYVDDVTRTEIAVDPVVLVEDAQL